MSYTIRGARLIGAGGIDAGPVTPVDSRVRVQTVVVYTVVGGTAEVSRPELHKLLWALRFGPDGILTHLGPAAFKHLQAKGLAPKFTARLPKPPGPVGRVPRAKRPAPAGTQSSAPKRSASEASADAASAIATVPKTATAVTDATMAKPAKGIVCSHTDPDEPPCAACESYQLGFRSVPVVKSWGESARALVRDLDRGILCILGQFRLEALGLPIRGPGISLRAAGFQLLSPTQLALSRIDAATSTHIATAAFTSRNVVEFNGLRQVLACFSRIVSADTWKTLVETGATTVPMQVLRKLPRGVALDAPDNASRFSLIGSPSDDGSTVVVVLPDVVSAIRGLALRADRVFVSIVGNGLGITASSARVAYPLTYVPPSPGTPDDVDTIIRGAETMSWSTLVQVLRTAPRDGRIVFEGCYFVPEPLQRGQVPFLYLFATAVRRDFIQPGSGVKHALYAGQPLLPPGTVPKRSAVLFKAIRKLGSRFREGALHPVENNLVQIRAAAPLVRRAVAFAFPGAPPGQSEPAAFEPQPE